MAARVACFGGAHIDVTTRPVGRLQTGTSNPAITAAGIGGVAANVARNLARLGVSTSIYARVGDDADGRAVMADLDRHGVDTSGVATVAGFRTASYLAVIDGGGSLVVGMADMAIHDGADRGWLATALELASGADIWFLDANLPESALIRIVAGCGSAMVAADPVSVDKAVRLRHVAHALWLMTPDAAEAARLSGESDPVTGAARLRDAGVGTVLLSRGADGAVLADVDGVRTVAAVVPDRVIDETGAGDAQAAGWLFASITGRSDPIAWGMAAASLAVEVEGPMVPDLTPQRLADRIAR